jgi:predicted dinucleotide-binding enzyme
MRIAVIGTGRVGRALGGRWREQDHDVTFGARTPREDAVSIADAARDAEVVVLAVPYDAALDAIAAAGDLDGKVLVDCTNPVGPNGLKLGTTTSAAEQIASHASGARVVKSFNTTGAENMANSDYGEAPLAMPIAGDDADAKRVVSELARDLGFDVLDVGPLSAARYLEPFAMVWISLARGGLGRDIGFALLRR